MNTLYLVWREPGQRWWPVGRLVQRAGLYAFAYTQGARMAARAGFRPVVGFDDWDKVYVSAALFPLFANRLLPRNRPEHARLPHWADLDGADPDPMVVLGRTLGPRVTDMFEVFPQPEPDEHGRYTTIFFSHGVAHHSTEERRRILSLEAGEALTIEPEPDNPADSEALRIVTKDRVRVGFVPRYLCQDLHALRRVCPQGPYASVRRVNLDAPPQFLLLCTITACWPAQFEPCSETEYQPINPRTGEILAQLDQQRPVGAHG